MKRARIVHTLQMPTSANRHPMNPTVIETTKPALGSSRSILWTLVPGFAWAGLSVAILSGWFVVTRVGFRHDLQVWDVIALRFGEGAILLTPTLLVGPSRLPMRAWTQGIALAILWGAPFILLVGIGLQLTSATLASSIAPALMPIFAGAIGWMMFGEPPQKLQIFGYILIAAGLLVLIYRYALTEGRPNAAGVLTLIIAAAMWATYTLRLRGSGLTPLQAAALICFWSAVFYVPIYIGLGLPNLGHTSGRELLFQSLYQGFMMSVVAIFAFNSAIALLGPRAAAAIVALMPVAATVLAIPVLGEIPSLPAAAAVCVIATGVMLAASSTQSKILLKPTGERA
jgi:drug/metabolite transporter (DMT)-like permease